MSERRRVGGLAVVQRDDVLDLLGALDAAEGVDAGRSLAVAVELGAPGQRRVGVEQRRRSRRASGTAGGSSSKLASAVVAAVPIRSSSL